MVSTDAEKDELSAMESLEEKYQEFQGKTTSNLTPLRPSSEIPRTAANVDDGVRKDTEGPSLSSSIIQTTVDEAAPPANSTDMVDWDGEDDPANPMNWKGSIKYVNVGLISAVTFVTYVTFDSFSFWV